MRITAACTDRRIQHCSVSKLDSTAAVCLRCISGCLSARRFHVSCRRDGGRHRLDSLADSRKLKQGRCREMMTSWHIVTDACTALQYLNVGCISLMLLACSDFLWHQATIERFSTFFPEWLSVGCRHNNVG